MPTGGQPSHNFSAAFPNLFVRLVTPATLQARWQTGSLDPENAVEETPQLLLGGVDTPALRELAGMHSPSRAEVEPVLGRALAELGIGPLPHEEAYRLATRDLAQRITDGRIDPYAGAAALGGLSSDWGHPKFISYFAGALDEWDEAPWARDEICAEVTCEAARLLSALRAHAEQIAEADTAPS